MAKCKDERALAEEAVAEFLRRNGFPVADRRKLSEGSGLGDISGCGGLVFQVEWGLPKESAGDATQQQIVEWMSQVELNRRKSGADFGVLFARRRGGSVRNVGAARAFLSMADLCELSRRAGGQAGDRSLSVGASVVVDVRFDAAVSLLREAGYGEHSIHPPDVISIRGAGFRPRVSKWSPPYTIALAAIVDDNWR